MIEYIDKDGRDKTVVIDYVNHEGKDTRRVILPISISYCSQEPYYPKLTWLLHAYCFQKQDFRSFELTRVRFPEGQDELRQQLLPAK